jgi:hypothetical protein
MWDGRGETRIGLAVLEGFVDAADGLVRVNEVVVRRRVIGHEL